MVKSQNPEVVIRKFFREIQLSGILTEAKSKRYLEKEPSRKKRRETARRRAKKNQARRGW